MEISELTPKSPALKNVWIVHCSKATSQGDEWGLRSSQSLTYRSLSPLGDGCLFPIYTKPGACLQWPSIGQMVRRLGNGQDIRT